MKAMVIKAFGGPDVFEEREMEIPEPGINELLVKVYAAAVNPVDYKIRMSGSWAGIKPPVIIGYDASGTVERTGPGVEAFKAGDEVFFTSLIFGNSNGTYAEYTVVNENIAALKPRNLSFSEAAAIPLAGGTAQDAIINLAKVRPGELVLIHAGAGGVGSFAVQMASASGARVIATCSEKNNDLVRSLGAIATINYKKEDFAQAFLKMTGGEEADVVFDTVGGDTIARSIEITKYFGRTISIVNTTGDLNKAYIKNIILYFLFLERSKHKMQLLKTLAEQGRIKPVIDSVFPLEQIAEAHKKIEKGGVGGKIVIKVRN